MDIFADIENIISKKYESRTKIIKKLIGNRIVDALLFFPCNVLIRKVVENLTIDDIGGNVIVLFTPTYIEERRTGKIAMRVFGNVASQELVIIFFNAKAAMYFKHRIQIGMPVAICGKLGIDNNGMFEIMHPEEVSKTTDSIVKTKPIYSLSTGIDLFLIANIIENALSILSKCYIEEWIPQKIMEDKKWFSFQQSIHAIHHPTKYSDITLDGPYLQRLCFDECYAESIATKLANKCDNTRRISNKKELYNKVLQNLGFQLTNDQINTLHDIENDLKSDKRMSRLVQGDVGSGKTVVALLASMLAVDSGYQVAILAPTELLARQHYEYFAKYYNYTCILISSETGKQRKEILYGIETGIFKIIIGTHAIISESVKFNNLFLVIVDEQHRFGVNQRLQLISKGNIPHVLSMTATPIPRTLVLTMSGDVAVSTIKTKPSGRLPIITRVFAISRISEIVETIQHMISKQKQVYWVCPLIEESEKLDYTCVIKRFEYMQQIFGDKVSIMHGKMNTNERSSVFQNFINGKTPILISTTIIEVGVDVPEAALIVIENAEKFGLAQLHQLRGRVGRGNTQSYCFLLYDDNIGDIQRKRISIIRNSNDGFEIAEQDLLIRGGGEIIGYKQSGTKIKKTYRVDDTKHANFIHSCIKQTAQLSCNAPNILLQIFLPDNFKDVKKSF